MRVFDAAFFQQFAPQTALEMLVRVPGFSLREASENRGLSQGGTNVLLDRRPIIGKGDTATNQIAQIAAARVLRIEILDAGALDLPGFSGLVANIVTNDMRIAGAWVWEPQWRRNNEPALLNGGINVSGSHRALDFSAAIESTMVRAYFFGPETVSDDQGTVFETREERRWIEGNQPQLSGSVQWDLAQGRVLNAKASLLQLNLQRPQTSATRALTERGTDSLNEATFGQLRNEFRFDTDYSFPVLRGDLKLIAFGSRTNVDASTRVTVDQPIEGRTSDRRFRERSTEDERVLRLEQSWDGHGSWQLAAERVINQLSLATRLSIADPDDFARLLTDASTTTDIEEHRSEVTIAHRRAFGAKTDLQVSVGGETSTIEQGGIKRRFDRPKGFVSLNVVPSEQWTLAARVSREIGQINFRDFAASVSLIEEVVTETNPELVPQQSWLYSLRAEHRFESGHVASVEFAHEDITDLVGRIPLGEQGDAIGNIERARREQLIAVVTLLGAPLGLPGAQLDLRGSWQRSKVGDPIGGFERDIDRLRTRDLRAEFRHDIPGSSWSYGLVYQNLRLAPFYQSTLVQYQDIPPGGLTPGENAIFVEHKDLLGLRVRATLSEFIGQRTQFARTIHGGRRDIAPVDRVERRTRELGGPFFALSISRAF